ncbi:MAG: hypothetical protein M1547_11145 [Gammaproteobacteria bacterium]|nr:hypothetical protein [Gammaproteobacteria bacterium]
MDKLIQLVAQQADISPAQAALAISAILNYLTARLPPPAVGRVREQLTDALPSRNPDYGQGGVQ